MLDYSDDSDECMNQIFGKKTYARAKRPSSQGRPSSFLSIDWCGTAMNDIKDKVGCTVSA